MGVLLDELEARWRRQFQALARGEDLAPGDRLRCEGLMEAAVLVGEAEPESVQRRMARCYEAVFATTLEAQLGADWRDAFPFPELPVWGRRAPVSPTGDD